MNNKFQTILNSEIEKLGIFTAIALTVTIAPMLNFPANAQTDAEPNNLENIEAGTNSEWSFSGTSESLSIEDEVGNLQNYSIQNSELNDLKLTEESRRRDSDRGIKDYGVEAEVYNY